MKAPTVLSTPSRKTPRTNRQLGIQRSDLPLAGAGAVEETALAPEAASLERSAVDRLRPLPGFLPAPETLLRDCRPALATWVSLLPTGRLGPLPLVPSATRSSFRLMSWR